MVFSAAVRAISVAWSCISAGTSMRVGALHDCPLFSMQASTPLVTTASNWASSRTMLADLPPSSWATRLTVSAAPLATSIPARVEPVNDTISNLGCAAIAAPTVGPSPSTRLKTPAGMPAASKISASRCALSGAISLGFKTIVQPAAKAGATLQETWLTGQFHGVMKPHTPTGSFIRRVAPRSSSNAKFFRISSVVAKWPRPAAA